MAKIGPDSQRVEKLSDVLKLFIGNFIYIMMPCQVVEYTVVLKVQSRANSRKSKSIRVMFQCWVNRATTTTLEVKSKFQSRKNVLWHICYEIIRMDLVLHAFARDRGSAAPLTSIVCSQQLPYNNISKLEIQVEYQPRI